ncbi:isoprenoid synthase domain-containing protein [Dichotomopilus funicola]|uniref:Isoprenoid synthase domain-containing protein n=1 Tax=Dichotomopilus funicola TaxID=1934379 RepID=A0AAN6UWQ5_9PEZI|nr:isoprenoid synthase domain-containing protein [Dichotomopilus funicola]
METPHARCLDSSTYDTTFDGFCAPTIPVLVHRDARLADRGAFRAQRDWQHICDAGLPQGFSGISGPEHNYVATAMPGVLPERIELVSYMVELMFIGDDVVNEAESPAAVAGPMMMGLLAALRAARRATENGNRESVSASASPAERVWTSVATALFEMDRPRAEELARWFEKMVTVLVTQFDDEKHFENVEQYLEYRRMNMASQFSFGLVLFGIAADIPKDQQEVCFELTQAFWMQTCLVNDSHSWGRERDAAAAAGQKWVSNAIWVLINKHSMTHEAAQAFCRRKASKYAAEYERTVAQAMDRDDLCRDAKRLLDNFRLGMTGNVIWGLQCPRYQKRRKLTEDQLQMKEEIMGETETFGWTRDQIVGVDDQPEIPPFPFSDTLPKRSSCINGPPNDMLTNGSAVPATRTKKPLTSNAGIVRDVPALNIQILTAPSQYLDSLPGKGIRDKTIGALNTFYQVSPQQQATISRVIDLLHGASLLLDDIHDSSQLRRGKPATHRVFGVMQTINTAGYRFLDALKEVLKLDNERCMDIFCEELENLYLGQSHDVSWTSTLECPSEEEYLSMVDGKTSALFRMSVAMLDALSDHPQKPDIAQLNRFMNLLGRMFQIRDDYMNLTSAEYTKQKGFCEDLDEGKFSLPLIHALGRCEDAGGMGLRPQDKARASMIRNLLAQRLVAGKMTLDQKKLVLEQLKAQGSLEYTRRAIDALHQELGLLAQQTGLDKIEELMLVLAVLKV